MFTDRKASYVIPGFIYLSAYFIHVTLFIRIPITNHFNVNLSKYLKSKDIHQIHAVWFFMI